MLLRKGALRVARSALVEGGVFSGAYFLAALLPLAIAGDDDPFPVFYPTLGILFAWLLRTGRRTWPVWVGLTLPLSLLAHAIVDLPLHQTFSILAADSVSALLGAWLLERVHGRPFRLDGLRSFAGFVWLGALVAPIPGACVTGVLLHVFMDLPILRAVPSVWGYLAVAILLTSPVILLWDHGWPRSWFARGRGLEFTLLLLASAATPVAIYVTPDLPVLSLIMAPLLWAAIRFRPLDAAVANLILGFATLASLPAGREWILGRQFDPLMGTFHVHVFLALMAVGPSLVVALTLSERQRSGAALERDESRLRALLDHSPMAIAVRDFAGRYLVVNRKFQEWYGAVDPAAGTAIQDIFTPAVTDQITRTSARIAAERRAFTEEYEVRTVDGQLRLISVTSFPILDHAGKVTALGAIGDDVTDAKRAEEHLRQAQKMEAVGQLTGGVAHDFNNLLAVIIGNLELVLETLPPSDPEAAQVGSALDSAERGATLTRRLLAFSRKQALTPVVADLNQVISGMRALLQRALGEHAQLEITAAHDLWRCEVDPSQVENALLNLAINARDAMGGGGTLTIETSNVQLDDDQAASLGEVPPGDYVMIAVADTGEGMTDEVRLRAFEPFFTTKAQGKGTGLGLAMVHGFVAQSGGHVGIDSAVGNGTTIRIYLPRSRAEPAEDPKPAPGDPEPRGRQERILVVEDDADVRALAVLLLEDFGYDVIEAGDGQAAIDAASRDGRIDLLLTDVVLSGGMSGRDVADTISATFPSLRVLYMSGYTANVVLHQGRLDPKVELLQKPFRRLDLARAVRRALDRDA